MHIGIDSDDTGISCVLKIAPKQSVVIRTCCVFERMTYLNKLHIGDYVYLY